MKNKAFYGRYIAQDGDIRVETFPADRKTGAPSQHTISRHASGAWKWADGGNCSENVDDRYIKGLKLAGTHDSTRYYRKVVEK